MCCHYFVLDNEMVHVQMARFQGQSIVRTAKLVPFPECNDCITKMVDNLTGYNVACVCEMGVYTTLDIVSDSLVTFSGSSEHETTRLYGSAQFITVCE